MPRKKGGILSEKGVLTASKPKIQKRSAKTNIPQRKSYKLSDPLAVFDLLVDDELTTNVDMPPRNSPVRRTKKKSRNVCNTVANLDDISTSVGTHTKGNNKPTSTVRKRITRNSNIPPKTKAPSTSNVIFIESSSDDEIATIRNTNPVDFSDINGVIELEDTTLSEILVVDCSTSLTATAANSETLTANSLDAIDNNSQYRLEASENRPPITNSDDDFTDDSDEDLYECNFNDLKKAVYKEIKNISHQQAKVITEVVENVGKIDSDLDLYLSPVPKRKVYRPRLSRKSKFIQAALQAAKDNLCRNNNYSLENSLDDVYIEENVTEFTHVRICWGTTYKRYEVSTEEPFANLYNKLAEEHYANLTEIVLSLKGKIITPSETVKSIEYTRTDIIEGGIINEIGPMKTEQISLKIQCGNKRDCVTINIGKFAKMEVIMKEYAIMKNSDISKFSFHFDGEKLPTDATPFSLDLEGDECIDVYEIA